MGKTNLPSDRQVTPEMWAAIRKWSLQVFLGLIGYGILIFAVAGTLRWGWGWVFLGAMAAFTLAHLVVLVPTNPGLLVERGRGLRVPGSKAWDLWISIPAAGLFPFASWVVAGLDFRLGWSNNMSSGLHLAGLGIYGVGAAVFLWAMASNPFFSESVRIQTERGHTVSRAGPYSYIRHPGYLGAILMQLATPFLLGSPWALIPSTSSAALYVLRTFLEDNTLLAELTGYQAYTEETRSRLLPGIW